MGSPFVVSEMEKQEKLNPDAIVVGFERNTGFFIQTPIKLPNGNTVKKLATRDAAFILLSVNLMIKKKGLNNLDELIDSIYTGKFESYSWSGGVTDVDPGYFGTCAPLQFR